MENSRQKESDGCASYHGTGDSNLVDADGLQEEVSSLETDRPRASDVLESDFEVTLEEFRQRCYAQAVQQGQPSPFEERLVVVLAFSSLGALRDPGPSFLLTCNLVVPCEHLGGKLFTRLQSEDTAGTLDPH